MIIWPYMGIWAYAKKIWSNGVYPKRASKMWLRQFKSYSQKLFSQKMPCNLHYNTKKISKTISRQVSDRAQLPDVLKFNVDKESKP